jgi:hypothetical protein
MKHQTSNFPRIPISNQIAKKNSEKGSSLNIQNKNAKNGKTWATFKLHIKFYYLSNSKLLFQKESLHGEFFLVQHWNDLFQMHNQFVF